MNSDVEIAIKKDQVLKMFGWSYSKFKRRRKELLALGVIFYRREGKNPQPKLYAFPSRIRKYIAHKAAKGEYL